MIFYRDERYNFFEIFNENTGSLLRSNLIVSGKESSVPARLRTFPELIDVGIMGHCHAAYSNLCQSFGVDCYQNGHSYSSRNLSLESYKLILEQCRRRVFQIVLGGIGDPNKHENFDKILELTRHENIIPNLTTSGFNLSDDEAQLISYYCGAVAVSFYSKLDKNFDETSMITELAVKKLINFGCKVNIHYVLSNTTINDAIYRLRKKKFPNGINAVIFLLYKPIGEGKIDKVIDVTGYEYLTLLDTIESIDFDFRIGFDTCQSPALRRFCTTISQNTIESCEASRFSMYIGNDYRAYPCSFAYSNSCLNLNLNDISIQDAWDSFEFSSFRDRQEKMCFGCNIRNCSGCALDNGVTICIKTTFANLYRDSI
ncbi:MAG: hypothetical protein LBJ14_08515 [Desulfarculales bacterium]|jgi:MoaA/NifB/PqqE/SkfB family radical SAM enzyme|nr:hypothetical protein [Desulfarculales bacterium]